jgi:MFS family permease
VAAATEFPPRAPLTADLIISSGVIVPLVEHLFLRPGPPSPLFEEWAMVLFGAYVGLALGILVAGLVAHRFGEGHGLRRRVARNVVLWGLLLQAAGVLIVGLRFANWPVLSSRIWLYLQLTLEVVAAGYIWWWFRNRYPSRLAQFDWEARKRAYLPKAAGGTLEPARRKVTAGRKR